MLIKSWEIRGGGVVRQEIMINVSGDGTIVVGGNNVTSEREVVRPAMWIKYC